MKTQMRKKENAQRRQIKKVYWYLLDACSANGNDLIKCAKVLLDNSLYSKSFLMSYLALEELGKRLAICDYITDILSEEEFQKIFRDHHLKMAYLHNKCEVKKIEGGNIFDQEVTIVYDTQKYRDFFIEKQKATYVDFNIQNETILSPLIEVTQDDAKEIYQYAIGLISNTYHVGFMADRIGTKAWLK